MADSNLSSAQKVKALLIMGYTKDKAMNGLKICNWDLEQAKTYLRNPAAYSNTEQAPAKALEGPNYSLAGSPATFGPADSRYLKRPEGTPDDLRNVAQLSFQSSLVRCLQNLPSFVERFFHSQPPTKLAAQVQRLISFLALSNKNSHGQAKEAPIQGQISSLDLQLIRLLEESSRLSGLFRGALGAKPISQLSLDVTSGEFSAAMGDLFNNDLLTEIPQALVVHIQRLRSDSEKTHQKFTFPLQFQAGLYMDQFKEVCTNLRERRRGIAQNIDLLEDGIRRFSNYKGLALEAYLGAALTFLSSLESNSEVEQDGLRLYSPERLSTHLASQALIEQSIGLMAAKQQEARAKVQIMQEQLAAQTKALEGLFDVPELKQHEYCLQSIMMHDGDADAGYFYAYVHDGLVWRRDNDSQVLSVPLEQVLTDAYGGYGKASAFALLFARAPPADEHAAPVPSDLQEAVALDSESFKETLSQYESAQKMKEIQDVYRQGYDQVMQLYCESQGSSMDYSLVNFALYIRLQGEEELLRWYLLDSCLNDLMATAIRSLSSPAQFLEQFRRRDLEAPKSMHLTAAQQATMKRLLQEFRHAYVTASLNLYAAEQLMGDNLVGAMLALNKVLSNRPEKSAYAGFAERAFYVLLLKVTNEMLNLVSSDQLEEGKWWARALMTLDSLHLHPGDWAHLFIAGKVELVNDMLGGDQDFGNVLQGLNSREVEMSVLTAKVNSYEYLIEQLERTDFYQWVEGWEQNRLATKYAEMPGRIAAHQVNVWFEMADRKQPVI